jgi:hypothetical protein
LGGFIDFPQANPKYGLYVEFIVFSADFSIEKLLAESQESHSVFCVTTSLHHASGHISGEKQALANL